MRRLFLAFGLALTLLVPAGATTAAEIKLPRSAAEWASFSPGMKRAAEAWVHAEYRRLKNDPRGWVADTARVPITIEIPAGGSGKGLARTWFYTSGWADCGTILNNQVWGTFARPYALTQANGVVWWLDTGLTGGSNKWARTGTPWKQTGGIGGGGNRAYHLPDFWDYKWSWETVTYSALSNHTIQWQPGSYSMRAQQCFKVTPA